MLAAAGLLITADDDSFLVQYQSEHREAGIHFVWNARIEGSPGRIATMTRYVRTI
jgi:hypothetical protein